MEEQAGKLHASLIDRAKAIILKPKEEWPKIAAEPGTRGDILRSYVLPLAAIGPVASFIGGQIFGYGAFGFSSRPGTIGALGTAILSYILTIVGVFILAFIADWLAPKFDGQSNKRNAFKLVAYGATAAWLAQIFYLVPALSFFGILGLYSLYLFYTGTTPLMAVPEDKRIGYTVVTFIAAFVLNVLVGMIVGGIIGLFAFGGPASSSGNLASGDDASMTIPGVGTINTGKMKQAAERMEKMQNGEIKAVPTDTLRTMLPETIGPFERTGLSTTAMGEAGSGVEGEYKNGNHHFNLRIQDLFALSGLAGIGSAMGVEQSHEDANGYDRMGTVNGQWREEEWHNAGNTGKYVTLVGDRFRIEAGGTVQNMNVLKTAVGAIDQRNLEKLANQ